MPKTVSRNLTDKLVRSLKPKDRQYEVPDASLRGFSVRVNRNGTRTFAYRYSSPVHGKRRRVTVGHYERAGSLADARREAERIRGLVIDGVDPMSPSSVPTADESQDGPTKMTFERLVERWIEEYARANLKPRTLSEYERILEHDLFPAFEGLPAEEVGPKRVRQLLLKVHRRGGVIGNRTHSVLRSIFDYGVELEVLDSNPAAAVRKLHKEKAPKRTLIDPEIAKLWHAWTEEGTIASCAMKLYLLTGLRFEELLSRPWQSCFDEKIVLKADETKNGEPHTVYLSSQALSLVEVLREATGKTNWLFPSPRRAGERHIGSLNKAVERYREASGVPHWSIQTLRRTAATILARLGTQKMIIDLFLNHKPGDVTHASYVAHRYADELREATQQLGDHVEEVVGDLGVRVRSHRRLLNRRLS